ncbi:serine/threonine protein kinase [Legionella gratiana]|uniref:Serine/threonine protein kinase n=1 Tax=Legionella gratiana TaxID=45066 RepID=A0A378JA86_9GAMM|nr:hypothetical protein [Legionella gratiana]KTD06577.1 serine/threonine protein kinase [Legionella gratiana]STX44713.1 serine/threonine protein kinase [Legionella gratiana]
MAIKNVERMEVRRLESNPKKSSLTSVGFEDTDVKTLNGLINEYNDLDQKTKSEKRILLLQRIDCLSQDIFKKYSTANTRDTEKLKDANAFYSWFKSDPLLSEVTKFCKENDDINVSLNNQRIFELHSPKIKSGGCTALSNKVNEQLKMIGLIDPELKESLGVINEQLLDLHRNSIKLHNHFNDSIYIDNYYQNLCELQQKIASVRNNLSSKTEADVFTQFDKMLLLVNSEKSLFIKEKSLHEKDHCKRYKNPIESINELLCQGETHQIIKLLQETKDANGKKTFTLGDYTFKGLGGQNNKNWMVTDKSGTTYAVRLENCSNFPFRGMDREKIYQNCKQHVEKNIETITLGKHKVHQDKQEVEYVLAIGEYCPNGNILDAMYQINLKDPKNFSKALEKAIQVAEFNLELMEKGYIYSDKKPENFLERVDGTVITSDLKSITPLDADGNLTWIFKQTPATPFDLPLSEDLMLAKYDAKKIDPNLLACHLIATLLHTMIRADKEIFPEGTHSRQDSSKQYKFTYNLFTLNEATGKYKESNDEDPIFKTPQGQKMKNLIETIESSVINDKANLAQTIKTMKSTLLSLNTQNLREGMNEFRAQYKAQNQEQPMEQDQQNRFVL